MSLPLMLSGGRPWDQSPLGDGCRVLNLARERRLATQSVNYQRNTTNANQWTIGSLTIVLTRSAFNIFEITT